MLPLNFDYVLFSVVQLFNSLKFANNNLFMIWIRYECLLCFFYSYVLLIRPKMTWTLGHDTLLCREILVEEPFHFKMGTREHGHVWDKVATNLNKIVEPRFSVDQRAVRGRFLKLERGFKKKMSEEECASSISPPEPTELEQAIQDIIERGMRHRLKWPGLVRELQKRIEKQLNL